MIGVGFLRCFFFLGIMGWYTTSVWQTVDRYFRDQFKEYLEKEIESNEEIKKDIMMEAERIAIRKAMIKNFGKMGFAKEWEDNLNIGDLPSSIRRREKFGRTADMMTDEFLDKEYRYMETNQHRDGILEEGMDGNIEPGDIGEAGGTAGTVPSDGSKGQVAEAMVGVGGQDEIVITEGTVEISGPEGVDRKAKEVQYVEGSFQSGFKFSEEECRIDECGENFEREKEFESWTGRVDEDDEMCLIENVGKKDSCTDP